MERAWTWTVLFRAKSDGVSKVSSNVDTTVNIFTLSETMCACVKVTQTHSHTDIHLKSLSNHVITPPTYDISNLPTSQNKIRGNLKSYKNCNCKKLQGNKSSTRATIGLIKILQMRLGGLERQRASSHKAGWQPDLPTCILNTHL